MIITVNKDTLIFDNFKFKCCIGAHGITKHKKEGDKKTPKGFFNLGNLYYRKDRISKPDTKLKKIPINKKMGWCDDENNRNYNKLIKIEKKIKHEKLFKKNINYDLLIPIEYNRKKIEKGKGSAIFLHLTKNYKKTHGCVAIKKNDMLVLIKLINRKTKIKIF